MGSIPYSKKWAQVQNACPAVNHEDPKFIGCVCWKEIYKVIVIAWTFTRSLLLLWGSLIEVCLFPRSPEKRGLDKAEMTSLKSTAHAGLSPIFPLCQNHGKSSWAVKGTERFQRLTPNQWYLLHQVYVNLYVYLELAFKNKSKWVLRTGNKSIKEGNYSVCFLLLGLNASDCKE